MNIGVVILAYNLEDFLKEAIDSALNQTYQPTEIVVVNDGSSDGTQNVIDSYGSKINCIRHERNVGALPAHISGIEYFGDRKDVLAFLDGDDIWEKDKLLEIKTAFESVSDMIFCTHDFSIIDKNGSIVAAENDTHPNHRKVAAIGDLEKRSDYIKHSILSYKGIWLGSAFTIRASALDLEKYKKWVLGLPNSHKSHQDQPLAAFLVKENESGIFGYIHKKLFRYRVFELNTSGASRTIEQALNSIQRSRATILRTREIVEELNKPYELKRQDGSLLRLEFSEALYTNQFSSALRSLFLFWRAPFSLWEKSKETLRFIGCVMLGTQRFLRIK